MKMFHLKYIPEPGTKKKRLILYCAVLFSGFILYSRTQSPTNPSRVLLGGDMNRLTLARSLYMYLCENQTEVDEYLKSFPSVSADVMFLCWGANCTADHVSSKFSLFVSPWSSSTDKKELLVYLANQNIPKHKKHFYHPVQSRVFIINEKMLNLKEKLTWTTSRNKLYDTALEEEKKQGWRWAFLNFGDGDVHVSCPLAISLIEPHRIFSDEEVAFAHRFRSFAKLSTVNGEGLCYMMFDAFLLTVSPAISFFSGFFGPMEVPGLLTEVSYHIDAMFNAIHRDAAPFVLPYCPRYDKVSWWKSQVVFIYRSLCVFGHTIRFDGIQMTTQVHRPYPRSSDIWSIDTDMNLVPQSLWTLQLYLDDVRPLTPVYLSNYGGWSLEMTSDSCRYRHTAMNRKTCIVSGDPEMRRI